MYRRASDNLLLAVSILCSAIAYLTLPFPERRDGRRRWLGCRDLQTFSGSVCGDHFVDFGESRRHGTRC